MMTDVRTLLSEFPPITLEEMGGIRLMNRTDTKFVLTEEALQRFLRMAVGGYRVQEVEGEREADYCTVYLDTPTREMYLMHELGRAVREKIRVRTYVASGLTFLEVKNKDNHGRTDKQRIRVTSADTLTAEEGDDFLQRHAWYGLGQLVPTLVNRFCRITLVNNAQTERLTIDHDIRFRNLLNGHCTALPQFVVVELKRDGRTSSAAGEMLRQLRIHPAGFSKYCVGSALTDAALRQNRFKAKIRGLHLVTVNCQNSKTDGRID